jgi:DNA-binding HxlR family transcriptional regulator
MYRMFSGNMFSRNLVELLEKGPVHRTNYNRKLRKTLIISLFAGT